MAKFTEITSNQLKRTLARKFIPLGDRLRDLLTKFGLRTNRTSLVFIQWSGGQRGVGTPTVISEELILPSPKINDLSILSADVQDLGINEQGQIEVSEISGRYTEEQLMGRSADGSDTPEDTEFFWEIEFPKPDGTPGEKRRFFPRSAPSYEPGKLQWRLRLERSTDDRARNGDP